MKTKSLFFILGVLLIINLTALQTYAAENSAASKAVDLNVHYIPDDSNLNKVDLPQAIPEKKTSELGIVNEEKNTSTSEQKELINPYHRTVRTGLSF